MPTSIVISPGKSADYQRLIEALRKESQVQVHLAASWSDVAGLLHQSEAKGLFAYLEEPSHVVELLQVIKAFESKFRSKEIRMVLSLKLPPPVVELIRNRLQAFGVEEMLAEPMHSQVYRQKGMDALQKIWKKSASRPVLHFSEALALKSDYWLFKNGVAKRLANRWAVHLKGPAPTLARWLPIDPDGKEEGAWQWAPLDSTKNKIFQHEEGTWVFWGSRPPEIMGDRWSFTGSRPALGFFKNGECFGWRFHTVEDGSLILSKDSANAISLTQELQNTWEEKGLAEPLHIGVPPSGRSSEMTTVSGNLPQAIAPTLSPIGLGFLMSELLCKQDSQLEEISQRYCNYLGSAVGGMPVELWFCVNGAWKPAFRHPWFEDRTQACLSKLTRDFEVFGEASLMISKVKDHEGSLPIGALVFPETMSQLLSSEYSSAAGKMARGLLLSWIQSEQRQKQAA